MSYYKKQIKRLGKVRKLLNKKRNQLREMWEEGITLVTFHTTTRTLSLPFAHEAVATATTAYHEALSNQRKDLKQEAWREREQWAAWRELNAKDAEFVSDAKLAQAHGRAAVRYPKSGK